MGHQLCNTGLFEDFQEVNQITSMQSHVLANLSQIEENNDRELPLIEHVTCHNEQMENEEINEAAENDQEPVIQSYKLQLTRIQQLQKLVEDELEEFDTQRKCKVSLEEATETQVVNVVKGIEFVTNIQFNQEQENIHSQTHSEHPD